MIFSGDVRTLLLFALGQWVTAAFSASFLCSCCKHVCDYVTFLSISFMYHATLQSYNHQLIIVDMEYTWIYQEKAFDSLSWNFLSNALRSFNFGNSFINLISVFTPTQQVVSQTMVSHHQCFKSKELLNKEILCRHTSSLQFQIISSNQNSKRPLH